MLANRGMSILLRLDEAVAATGATYDRSAVTIEHVLPQKPETGV